MLISRCRCRVLSIGTLTLALMGPTTVVLNAQLQPDKATLLLAHFDRNQVPQVARGKKAIEGAGEITYGQSGRFGEALRLREGQWIAFPGRGNLDPNQGTIELWICLEEEPGEKFHVLSFRCGEHGYLHLNQIKPGRFGAAMRGGPPDDWVWRRVDYPKRDLKPDVWRHLAVTWGEGELAFYADGRLARRPVTDAKSPRGIPESIRLHAMPGLIDELRISDRKRTPEEIRASAQGSGKVNQSANLSFLTDAEPSSRRQQWYPPTPDGRRPYGELDVPLVFGGKIYPRGLATTGDAEVAYDVPADFDRLIVTVGVSQLAPAKDRVSFRIVGEGKTLLEESGVRRGDEPKRATISLEGVKRIRFLTESAGDAPCDGWADWGELILLKPAQAVPPPQCKPFPKWMSLPCRLKVDAYKLGFELAESKKGYRLAPWLPLDDLDPNAPPPSWPERLALDAFATPGEYEPVSFVIYADKPLMGVRVEASDLRGPAGKIPSDAVDLRYVMRCPHRKFYWRPAELCELVSRFLLDEPFVHMPARTFRQVYAMVRVPDDAKPGTYAGVWRIKPEDTPPSEVRVALEVLPFRLDPPGGRQFGMYYRFRDFEKDIERMELEMADIREHGANTLKPNIGIEYVSDGDDIRVSDERLLAGLRLMRKHGFLGSLPVGTGLRRLAGMCGVGPDKDNPPAKRARFEQAGLAGLKRIVEIDKRFPQFELVATHMDEVLTKTRLPTYVFLTELVRRVPDLRIYITMHNRPDAKTVALTKVLDPYVDIRSYNGHQMEAWLEAGHSFDDLADELKAAGDVAWTYHNIRGSFFVPEWTRLVNGYWLWMSPIRCHVPWMYQHTKVNPLDDTDGPRTRGHDFGYAVTSPEDGKTPIPTRHWEAYREGIDDLRYVATLERLLADAEKLHTPSAELSKAVQGAKAWLGSLRGNLPNLPDDLRGIEEESPLLVWLSAKYGAADYKRWRRRTADAIVKLRAATGAR